MSHQEHDPFQRRTTQPERMRLRFPWKRTGAGALAALGLTGAYVGIEAAEADRTGDKSAEISAVEYQNAESLLKEGAKDLLIFVKGESKELENDKGSYKTDIYSSDIFLEMDSPSGYLESYTAMAGESTSSRRSVSYEINVVDGGVALSVDSLGHSESTGNGYIAGASSREYTFYNSDFDLASVADQAGFVEITPELISSYLDDDATHVTELTTAFHPDIAVNTPNGEITTQFIDKDGKVTIVNKANLVRGAAFAEDFESTPKNVLDMQLELFD